MTSATGTTKIVIASRRLVDMRVPHDADSGSDRRLIQLYLGVKSHEAGVWGARGVWLDTVRLGRILRMASTCDRFSHVSRSWSRQYRASLPAVGRRRQGEARLTEPAAGLCQTREGRGSQPALGNGGIRSCDRVASTGACQSDCFPYTRACTGFLRGLFRGGSRCVKFVTSALGRSVRYCGRAVHGDGLDGPKGRLAPNIRMAGREGFQPESGHTDLDSAEIDRADAAFLLSRARRDTRRRSAAPRLTQARSYAT